MDFRLIKLLPDFCTTGIIWYNSASGESRTEQVAELCHTSRLTIFIPKILVTLFSHRHLLMAFFGHYLLRICTLPPLPSLVQLQSSPLHTYMCRSAALEKLEAVERHSGALCLTLTTGFSTYQLLTDSAAVIKCKHTSHNTKAKHLSTIVS